MSEYPPTVYRVLELAEKYALEADVPDELKNELTFCIGKGWAHIMPVCALLDPRGFPPDSPHADTGPYRDGPFRVVLPGDHRHPKRLLLKDEGRAVLAGYRMGLTGGEPDADSKTDNKRDWILVTEAVARLPFIHNLKALYKYAKDNPDKLRTRPDPNHKRQRQANAADVLQLEKEYEAKHFDALDGPAADNLPSFSEASLGALADRVTRIRNDKRK